MKEMLIRLSNLQKEHNSDLAEYGKHYEGTVLAASRSLEIARLKIWYELIKLFRIPQIVNFMARHLERLT